MSARTLEFFVLGCLWVLLILVAFADVLVRITPESYAAAAPLIPVLAAVFMLRGTFILSYQGSERQDRRRWLFAMFVVCLAVFVAACLLLIPPLEATGAALAGVFAYAVGTVAMLALALRGPDPMPLRWGRLAGAGSLAAVFYGLVVGVGQSLGTPGYLFDAVVVAAFPVLAIVLGFVPPEAVRPAVAAARAILPGRTPRPVREGLGRLDAPHLELLDRLLRRREPVAEYAQATGEEEATVRLRLVVVLRRLSELPPGIALRADMSRYVLEDDSVVHHASLGQQLIDQGSDPYALDALYQAALAVRALPRRRWPRTPDTPPSRRRPVLGAP